MTRKPSFLALGAVLAVLLVLATACGGGDDDSLGADDGTPTAQPSADLGDDQATDTGDGVDSEPTATEADSDETGSANGFLGEDVDPCTLLTPEEINDITGFSVGEGEDTTTDPFWSCEWNADEGSSDVAVYVYTGSTQDDLDLVYGLSDDGEPVDGLGVKAKWRTTFSPVLEVLTDKYSLSIYVASPEMETAELKTTSINLAEVVIERLP